MKVHLRVNMKIPRWAYWTVMVFVTLCLVTELIDTRWNDAASSCGLLLILWGMRAGWYE